MDEIGDFPIKLQPKLLRVLESLSFSPIGSNLKKHVNIRLIAATSRNIQEMIANDLFRSDLFHRLNVLSIELPPFETDPMIFPS